MMQKQLILLYYWELTNQLTMYSIYPPLFEIKLLICQTKF